MSALIDLLLCDLYECSSAYQNADSTIVDEAMQIIRQNPQRFFTTGELAGKYYICERTLTNHFKQKIGKSLYRFQIETKLEAVRLFLQSHPDMRLHEVAMNFGFCDEFHLSRRFKKQFGISPKQYNKACSNPSGAKTQASERGKTPLHTKKQS